MKKILYIHVGPPKTGTTAIQHFLCSNDKLLSRKGVHYITALRDSLGSHNPLASILFYKYHGLYNVGDSKQYVDRQAELLKEFVAEISGISEGSIILSAECLVNLGPEGVSELINLFSDAQIKIIFYIRDYYEQNLSHAAEVIKRMHKQTSTCEVRIHSLYEGLLIYAVTYVKSVLEAFGSKIGKENLIFRKYGRQYFKDGNIFSDFLDILGIELTDEFFLPEKLVNESLACCETLYFKDILNRLKLKTPEDLIIEKLFAWEKSHRGTRFSLPADVTAKVNELVEGFHCYLLDNYLDDSYRDYLSNTGFSGKQSDYKFSYDTFTGMLDYMDSEIKGFSADFMESLVKSLDKAYEHNVHLNWIRERFEASIRNKKAVALWGCGDTAETLFKKYDFDFLDAELYVVDMNEDRHGNDFMGHRILPPSIIEKKKIDTVIIASIRYGDEIIKKIKENYPCVQYVMRLEGLIGGLEIKDIRNNSWI